MRGTRLYHSNNDYPKIDAPKYTVRRGLPWPRNLLNGNYPYVVMGDIVTYLSNESGHYCPDEDSVYTA